MLAQFYELVNEIIFCCIAAKTGLHVKNIAYKFIEVNNIRSL